MNYLTFFVETVYVISLNPESQICETWRRVWSLGHLEAEIRELPESNVHFFFRCFGSPKLKSPCLLHANFTLYTRVLDVSASVCVCVYLSTKPGPSRVSVTRDDRVILTLNVIALTTIT